MGKYYYCENLEKLVDEKLLMPYYIANELRIKEERFNDLINKRCQTTVEECVIISKHFNVKLIIY